MQGQFVPVKLPVRILTGVVLLVAFFVSNAAPAEGEIVGQPWTGESGVTKTTAQIMERAEDYKRPPRVPWKTPKNRPRGHTNFENLLSSPDSPTLTGELGDEVGIAAGQSASVSFTGATLFDTSAYPPDSMGAAGPSQFIVAVNGRIRSFNKQTGVADGVLNVNPDVFFQSVMTPPSANNFTSDPRIRYDRLSGRWMLIIIDVPGQTGTNPNRIMLAVSDSGIITPATLWTFFQFQHDLVTPAGDTGKFADYPTLGIDANALYIGVNVFGTRGQGTFDNTTAFVVRKSSILGAGPIVVTAFRNLVSNNPNQGGPYTPQGVDNYDPNATEGYFIGVDSSFYGRLKIRRVSNPGGTPSISGNINLDVPLTGNTINVPHLGNTGGSAGNVDGLDYRLIAAHIRNGKLWTAANLAVNNVGAPNGTDTRMGIRWYELGDLSGTPTVLQSGTLYQPSASNTTDQRSYWMGSIMVSGQGHALMGFSAAGQNEYLNAGYAGRLKNDPPGTLRTPVLYTASSSAYNPRDGNNNPIIRWGDYSYTSLDPNDDMTMWTIQEWCISPNIYAVQVVRVLAPLPATPASCSPAALNQGTNNVNVTLLGSTDGDTGFFDPGAGFSNRIAAAVGGGGVMVNSITYNNPTNLTLNLSIAANATPGSRVITVTNPDSQSSASVGGILTINSVVASNNPPTLPFIADRMVTEGNLLTFTHAATDPDLNALTYSLLGAPVGATVTNNGVFTWTPTEAQGPSTNDLSMIVTDNGTPSLSATQTFSIFVLETNNFAPAFPAIADRMIHAGTTLTHANTGSDADVPANNISYSLDPGAPLTASVGLASGIFTWTPSDADAGSTNAITIRATDDGSPALESARTFTVIVVGRPLIASLTLSNELPVVDWTAISNQSYRLQFTTGLENPAWLDIAGDITATGSLATKTDPAAAPTNRFYRVRVLP